MEIKKWLGKHREVIVYLAVGGLTTVVCWGTCLIMGIFLNPVNPVHNFVINTVSWGAGVSFSYPASRKWVFKSQNPHIVSELLGFVGSRVSTWLLDVFIMWLFVNVITFKPFILVIGKLVKYEYTPSELDDINYWFVKMCISATVVFVTNYFLSKFFVFKVKSNNVTPKTAC